MMNEQQSLLECILQENNNVQHNKLSHNEINNLFTGMPEQENDFEEYQEMTLQQFFYSAIQKTEQSYKQEAEEILVLGKYNKRNYDTGRNMVFGAPPDSTVKVYFEKDDIRMRIFITPPKTRGKKISNEMLTEILEQCGVVHGIKQQYVNRLSRTPIYNTGFLIAEGTPPVAGEGGETDFQFDPEGKLLPKVDPKSGMIDYKELAYVKEVREGDILCKIKKPKPGKDGMSILGKVIKAEEGEKLRVEAGKNTKSVIEGEETHIIATCDGEVHYVNNTIYIDKILTVQDVDASTGNLSFIGTIYIKGNVQSGFKVKASGNIIVDGVVEDAKLSSSGDIVVRGGIKGSGLSEIKARGDISALFIEHATVFSQKNIYADYVLNSNIESEQKIKLSGKRGFIIGGKAKAVEIIAAEVGNDAYSLTKLEINYPKELLKKIADVKKEQKEYKKVLEQQERKIRLSNSEEAQLVLFRTKMAEKRLEVKLGELEARLEEIKSKTTIGVYVEEQLYPNVTILMENRNYHNKELKQKCSIRKTDGKWKIRY